MLEPLHMIEVSIPGSFGHLEGRLWYGEHAADTEGMILCPPHPLLAGNMENNVIQAVARIVAEYMPVLFFNYPAVGKSSSPTPHQPLFEFWHGLDQGKTYQSIAAEVRRVAQWSATYFSRYHLFGYSFGAYMALTALTPRTLSYTALAPPLAEEDFSSLGNQPLPPICLINAEKEDLLSSQLPSGLESQSLTTFVIPGADHFFRGKEMDVARQVVTFIQSASLSGE